MDDLKQTVRKYLDFCAVEAHLATATVSAYRRDQEEQPERHPE